MRKFDFHNARKKNFVSLLNGIYYKVHNIKKKIFFIRIPSLSVYNIINNSYTKPNKTDFKSACS